MNLKHLLADAVHAAMVKSGIPESFAAHVTLSKNPKFGDYQANGAMSAAKALKTQPRLLAQHIAERLTLDGIADKIEIAGPGFINIHLDQQWLSQQLVFATQDARFNIDKKPCAETVVVDYSAPNLAKEMHVGHLRSSIIGDAIVRSHEFLGDTVIRQNHVGDWGTQFGMLIAELEEQLGEGEQAELALEDLESFYRQAKKHFDSDEHFAGRAREYVVKLQSGDEKVLALWQKFRAVSLQHGQEVYQRLNLSLKPEDVVGESAYNHDLATLVQELKSQGLALEDQGAQVVYLEELADKEGKASVVLVQKNDGGYLYATTDLAALRYRSNTLKANRILYFIDDRQSLHMKQMFTLAKKAGFVGAEVTLAHHAFGKLLGKDKRPFKTRDGGTIKLASLLDEAVERAQTVIKDKESFSDNEIAKVARSVGIGAVKYADLSKTRTNDYVFDWESMLSLEGNTGPYMQYAYARCCSLFRKAGVNMDEHASDIIITCAQERALALKLLQCEEVITHMVEDAYPHTLCGYLYDASSLFSSFFEACPMLKDGVEENIKNSRLTITKSTARVLKLGLELLGIEVLVRM